MYMPAEPLIVEFGPSDGEKWSRQGSQIDGLDLQWAFQHGKLRVSPTAIWAFQARKIG